MWISFLMKRKHITFIEQFREKFDLSRQNSNEPFSRFAEGISSKGYFDELLNRDAINTVCLSMFLGHDKLKTPQTNTFLLKRKPRSLSQFTACFCAIITTVFLKSSSSVHRRDDIWLKSQSPSRYLPFQKVATYCGICQKISIIVEVSCFAVFMPHILGGILL